MKYLYLAILAGFLAGSPCWATTYHFTYNFKDGRMLKLKWEGTNRNKALEEAGVFCGKFFGIGYKDLTREQEDEILDVCANPG